MFTEIYDHLSVTFIANNKMVIMDDANNEIEYVKTNLLNLQQTLAIRVTKRRIIANFYLLIC